MMWVLLLVLFAAACVFFVGVALWVIFSHFFTVDIPAAIGHPIKLRVLHCLFHLLVTWVSLCFICPLFVAVNKRVGKIDQRLLVELTLIPRWSRLT